MSAVDVGALADFADGRLTPLEVARRRIGVLRRGSRIFAFADRCPHMGASMCAGRVGARLESPPAGDLTRHAEDPVLLCPWHGWEFTAADGRAVTGGRFRLRTYAVRVDADGRVLVDLSKHAEAAA